MTYSWNYLIKYHFNPPTNTYLKRNTQIQKLYDKYNKTQQFEHFKKNMFSNKNKYFNFMLNNFPYDIDKNISHYLIFINPLIKNKISDFDIYKIIRQNYIKKKQIIIFENEPKNRSIKNIRHYHIFTLNN